jgi:hypothetical protein
MHGPRNKISKKSVLLESSFKVCLQFAGLCWVHELNDCRNSFGQFIRPYKEAWKFGEDFF